MAVAIEGVSRREKEGDGISAGEAVVDVAEYDGARTPRKSGLPLEAIYRDAKIGEIYEGANEVQKWIIARRAFGRQMTG